MRKRMSSSGMGTPKAQRRIHPTFPACSSFVRFDEFISILPSTRAQQIEHQTMRVLTLTSVERTRPGSSEGNTSRKCSLFSTDPGVPRHIEDDCPSGIRHDDQVCLSGPERWISSPDPQRNRPYELISFLA